MNVLTTAEMREVDRRTIEMGIPGVVLMENAAHRVVEFLAEHCAPLAEQRIVVLCGKGNNGGDGLAIARLLFIRFHPRSLQVVLVAAPEDLRGDAAANLKMLDVCGCPVARQIPAEARNATLVIDALLGTGVTGAAGGAMLDAIREINHGFPLAKVMAVDIPSGMAADSGETAGEFVRADYTVTFTAPKPAHVLPPNCDRVGQLVVGAIGSPPSLYEDVWMSLVEPLMFASLLAPRPRAGHKGTFGHVLIVAGSRGKTGAAAMSGLGALRAGAGLVTVASAASAIAEIASHAPELMTEPLAESAEGSIVFNDEVEKLAKGMTVLAMGPGLGRHPEIAMLVSSALEYFPQAMVLDADALVDQVAGKAGRVRVLTPHPGEMSRLTGKTTDEVQQDRVGTARAFATSRAVTLVLKGERTLLAFPDGRVWINPTGTPAMGTGGTGDVLTGMISGFLAQFPKQPDEAVAAAVYLHGLGGEIGARALGEKSLIATDILKYLPDAISFAAALAGPEKRGDISHGV
jgi:ADP-dependent NAD(P)H-hydrate dehydratase / NAD(P)H-hydrate epimerase